MSTKVDINNKNVILLKGDIIKIKMLWKIPSDLGEHGAAIWKRVGKELVKNEQLDSLDYEAFLTLCKSYDRMMVADAQMQKDGIVVDGGDRGPKKHPAFAIWKASYDAFVRLLTFFGMSPHARGLKVKPKEVENEKSKFFN